MLKRTLFAALCALFLAAPASAQTPAPESAGYLVVVGKTLDREKMGAYARALAPIYQKLGGHYVGAGGPGRGVTCLMGPCQGRAAVVARLDRASAVQQFWWGEDYRQAIRIRDRAGIFTVWGIESEQARPFEGPETGLLLLVRMAPDPAISTAFADAAQAAGARIAIAATGDAMIPLEGDAFAAGLTLASFETKAAREAFLNTRAARRLGKLDEGAILLAIDAPPAPQR